MVKNILMICYYYPPLSDVGSKRSVAFSKYFKKHGWQPYILSVKNPDRVYCSVGTDMPPPGIPTEYAYSLFNPYKPLGKLNGALSRLASLLNISWSRNYFYDIFCIPDHFIGWVPLAFAAGRRLIKKHGIDLIYVSCTPHSASLIGIFLKWLSGKPLILDFRDPFALEFDLVRAGMPAWRKKINRRIEQFFLRHADIFVTNNEGTRSAYLRQYPQLTDKIWAVHNGFDPDGFLNEKKKKYEKFTIVYAGNFYFQEPESQVFFEALALLKSRRAIEAGTFQFLFYGDGKERISAIGRELHIEDLVTAHSRIPYQDVLDVLRRSHLQLLRIVEPMLSTKLFEGIPLNIPFLATIQSREAAEIIRRYSPSSYVVTEQSPSVIGNAIIDAREKYRNGEIKDNRIQQFLQAFSRENLSLKMMNIIESRISNTAVCRDNCEYRRHVGLFANSYDPGRYGSKEEIKK